MPTYIEAIESMKALGENWDSYGSDRANPQTLAAAAEFLRSFVAAVGLTEPQVAASRVGGVSALWILGNYELEIEFEPRGGDTFVTYTFEHMSSEESVRGDFTLGGSRQVRPFGLHILARALIDPGTRVAV
jgi:hypothetical protein